MRCLQTVEELSWVGGTEGLKPLIGGRFHTDISDDDAAKGMEKMIK